MSITVTIGGISRGVSPETLAISHTLFQRSVAEFTIPDSAGSIEVTVGQTVVIEMDSYTLFAGSVTEATKEKLGPNLARYLRIAAVDWSVMCDRRLAPSEFQWKGAKANDILRNIVTASLNNEDDYVASHTEILASDGTTTVYTLSQALSTPSVYVDGTLLSTGYTWASGPKTVTFDTAPARTASIMFTYNVECADLSLVSANSGPVIEEFKIGTNGETVAAALTRLCRDANGYYWKFDSQKRIVFATFASGPVIATISNSSGNIVADSVSATSTRQEFANVVRVFFSAIVEERTETLTGDGTRKVFSVGQEIVAEPVVRVGGVYQLVGLKGQTTGKEVYWSNSSKDIEFEDAPANATVIEVSFKGKSTHRVDAIDADSINERALAEGSSGIYEKAITIDEQISIERAQEIADQTLDRLASMSGSVTFQSNSILAVPGDRITSTVTGIPATTYLVRSVRMVLIGPDILRSTIELATGNLILSGLETLAGDSYVPGVGNVALERDARPKIPDVIIGEDAVTVGFVEIDGVLKIDISVVVTVPESGNDNRFEGVQLFLEIDGDRKIDLESKVCNVEAGEEWTIRITQDLPVTDETWVLYFVSRNWNRVNTPVWKTDDEEAYASPNVTIEAKTQPLVTEEGTPEVTDEHAGWWDADEEEWVAEGYYDQLVENLFVEWECKAPAETVNWSGLQIYIHVVDSDPPFFNAATGLVEIYEAEPPEPEGLMKGRLILDAAVAPEEEAEWEIIFCSYDRAGNRTLDEDDFPTGPSVTVTIPGRALSGGGIVPVWNLDHLQLLIDALPEG